MLPDIENLIALQGADREILRLKEEVASLPKRQAAIEAKLAGTKAVLDNAKAAVKTDEASRRKYESSINDLQLKISKYRDQSLEVKTNEQYKALLHEIQFAEGDIRANEDKILELMVNAEAREKQVKAAEAELKAETQEIEKEKAEARQRAAEDEKLLAEWSGKREKARASVNPDLLRHYDRVAQHRGSGLSEARDHKCMTCQVMLRPQTYNEVRSATQTVFCDSCQRILYYDPSKDAPTEIIPTAKKRRHHPKIDSPQAWFYRPEYGDLGEVFLAFFNDHGNSTRRIYDAASGRQLGDILSREGEYRLAFPEDLSGADLIRLNGSWEASEIEEWGSELPMNIITLLQRDLNFAIAESHADAHSESKPKSAPQSVAAS